MMNSRITRNNTLLDKIESLERSKDFILEVLELQKKQLAMIAKIVGLDAK